MLEAEATKNRRALPSVVVDPVRVQESGLVKDTLVLDIPDEAATSTRSWCAAPPAS